MRKKLVVIENNIIKRILDDSMRENLELVLTKYVEYPISNDLEIGEDIHKYDDSGNLLPNSKLVELGLIILKDNEILDGETIREKTEVEIYNSLSNKEKLASLMTPSDDGLYMREKTLDEKYTDGIITVEEYNENIIKLRAVEYSSTIDKEVLSLFSRKVQGEITEDEFNEGIEDISAIKSGIKQRLSKK